MTGADDGAAALGDLKDELGDLPLQVVFHAQMAAESDFFDFRAEVEHLAGFDVEHADQCADKVAEELAEVRQAATLSAARGAADAQLAEEVGAESALRAANAKFERRFSAMESLAQQRGEAFADLDIGAQERLWQAVKRAE